MRCDGAGPDSASPQPVTARAGLVTADGDIAARSQHRCHLWPWRSSLRDDDRPGGFSRPGGRARGGCRASGPIRRFTRAFAARTRGRVDVTTRGYCGDPNDRAVPRCVRAVARTEISVLIGAPFPLCLASLDRLSKLSTAAREQARAWSPPRVLSARAEKATLQHLQVAGPWHALCLSLPPGPPPPPPPASALT
jgi:hypothetical protein